MTAASRTYDVVAVRVPLVHGDGTHDPDGTIYTLARHVDELRAAGTDRPHPLVRPLVLRARVGERLVVHLRNDLDQRVGLHPQGVRYDVGRADGGVVGANPDSAAEPGGRRRYVWDCVHEGVFHLGDAADLRATPDGAQAHGLYGALVVEAAGASWTDPETGEALEDGLNADVHPPGSPSFREYVTFLQEGPLAASASYRRAPRAGADRHDSRRHGDPATPVLHAYAGDPARLRLVHAGAAGDTLVVHLHGYRWPSGSGPVDTVALGPQEARTVVPQGGAGSAGDRLWICDGREELWGLWRVFGTVQDGTGHHPDGTPVAALRPLPDRTPPPAPSLPSVDQPGRPAPRVGPPDAPVRRYDVVALACPVTYHRGERSELRDDHGLVYVLAAEIEAAGGADGFRARVASGAHALAPLAIRASVGDVVELRLQVDGPDGAGRYVHAHRVVVDPLLVPVGWNRVGTGDGVHRWYCADEGTATFHDPDPDRRRHGLYGCLVVEPRGARWTDPHDPDREVANAERAVVTLPDGTAFREQVLAVADDVPLVRGDGTPVPSVAVGYRCAPLSDRPGDPAERFAGAVHGDPATPLPESYPGEPVRLRVHQGAGRRRHSLVLHGLRWCAGGPRNQRAFGPSEAFDVCLDPPDGPGDRLWSLASGADTALGGWGLLRVHDEPVPGLPALPGPPGAPRPTATGPVRRYRVRAVDTGHPRRALAYTVDGHDDGVPCGPLVLRARVGEWVEVTLTNELPGPRGVGPGTPSDRVSLQAAALRYDVRGSDGAFVGRNPDTTAKPGHSVTYRWFADVPGPVALSDRADAGSRRGLVGVLVVEPEDASMSGVDGGNGWVGERAVLHRPGRADEHELVLLRTDAERASVNHRRAPLRPGRPSLADPNPATPVLCCAPGDRVRIHLAGGADRPDEGTFTVHGHDWPRYAAPGAPRVGTVRGPAAGGVRTLVLTAGEPGDYAYRSGSLDEITDGLWGILRVRPRADGHR